MSDVTKLQNENKRLRTELGRLRVRNDRLAGKILKIEKEAAYREAQFLRLQQKHSTQEHKSCVNKVIFSRRQTAESRAKKSGLSVYRCQYCNKWHMTSRNSRKG